MKTMIKKPNNEPTSLELDSINDISAYFNNLYIIYTLSEIKGICVAVIKDNDNKILRLKRNVYLAEYKKTMKGDMIFFKFDFDNHKLVDLNDKEIKKINKYCRSYKAMGE